MRMDVHPTWGYKDKKTGMITGMSGQLQRKEGDIGGKNSIFLYNKTIYYYVLGCFSWKKL